MSSRNEMKPHRSTGGYELTAENRAGLLLTDRASRLYAQWRQLQNTAPDLADSYLQGIADGVIYEMTGKPS